MQIHVCGSLLFCYFLLLRVHLILCEQIRLRRLFDDSTEDNADVFSFTLTSDASEISTTIIKTPLGTLLSQLPSIIESTINKPLNPCQTQLLLLSSSANAVHSSDLIIDTLSNRTIAESGIVPSVDSAADSVWNLSLVRKNATQTQLILEAFRDSNFAEYVQSKLENGGLLPTPIALENTNCCEWNANGVSAEVLNISCIINTAMDTNESVMDSFSISQSQSQSESPADSSAVSQTTDDIAISGTIDFACFPDSIRSISIVGQSQITGDVNFQYLPSQLQYFVLSSNAFESELDFDFDDSFWPQDIWKLLLNNNSFFGGLHLPHLPTSLSEFDVSDNKLTQRNLDFGNFFGDVERNIESLFLTNNLFSGDLDFVGNSNNINKNHKVPDRSQSQTETDTESKRESEIESGSDSHNHNENVDANQLLDNPFLGKRFSTLDIGGNPFDGLVNVFHSLTSHIMHPETPQRFDFYIHDMRVPAFDHRLKQEIYRIPAALQKAEQEQEQDQQQINIQETKR